MFVRTCTEKQQVVQETQSETHSSDSEYKLFMHYYNKLNNIPSLVDLASYFVTANIITRSDGETIANHIATESQTVALRKLLNKLSLILLRGQCDSKSFEKMLRIMQIYGSDTAQLVASEMLEAVISVPLPVQATSPNTGIYVFMELY